MTYIVSSGALNSTHSLIFKTLSVISTFFNELKFLKARYGPLALKVPLNHSQLKALRYVYDIL